MLIINYLHSKINIIYNYNIILKNQLLPNKNYKNALFFNKIWFFA